MKIYRISSEIIAYHASLDPSISRFDDFSHFGTREQADFVAEERHIFEARQVEEEAYPIIYCVRLRINNPKNVRDVGDDSWGGEIDKAIKEGYDSLTYENTFEGEGTSYLVFNGDNVEVINKTPYHNFIVTL